MWKRRRSGWSVSITEMKCVFTVRLILPLDMLQCLYACHAKLCPHAYVNAHVHANVFVCYLNFCWITDIFLTFSLSNWVRDQIPTDPTVRIYTTGHSLGAVMSLYAAAQIQKNRINSVTGVYPFASPKSGSSEKEVSWLKQYRCVGSL